MNLADAAPKTTAQYFADWESHVFGFGYGTGEEHTIPALRTLLALCDRSENGGYDYRLIVTDLGAEVTWLLINILGHADVIEYGTSPRFGWLTAQGQALRRFVMAHSEAELIALTETDTEYHHCYPDACNCGPTGYEEGRVCRNPFWLEAAAVVYLAEPKR